MLRNVRSPIWVALGAYPWNWAPILAQDGLMVRLIGQEGMTELIIATAAASDLRSVRR